jgi:UDPglucose 6-dehydrogenase
MNKRTGIMGVGFVGGALAKCLEEPILYDLPKRLGSVEELNRADIIFICVPTPYNEKGFDASMLEDAFSVIKGNKIVVIKSTVIPGTTERFQAMYPNLKVLFNPEFLTEKTADFDMRRPDRQIIGYTKESYSVAEDIILMLPLAPFERIMPAKEAEMVKYFNNSWFGTKVVFCNQMYDLCKKMGVDYDSIKECVSADRRIGKTHLEIWYQKNFRGYSGKCLPKDIKSLLQFAEKIGADLKLLKVVDKINDKLIKITK